jgi:hypothetical protein
MRIECTQGCGAMLNVKLPQFPEIAVAVAGSVEIAVAQERYAEIRAESDRAVGHAVTEAVVAHMMFDCTVAAAADADCGNRSPMGYVCNLQTKHEGDHQYQVDDADAGTTHTIATWPNLTLVQP